ncbi:MAG: hypothetical protein CL920_03420 [Deltaproteobacteria bacterium]|nr:hypothetical protein [Deltaproteobacteria bacterium]
MTDNTLHLHKEGVCLGLQRDEQLRSRLTHEKTLVMAKSQHQHRDPSRLMFPKVRLCSLTDLFLGAREQR